MGVGPTEAAGAICYWPWAQWNLKMALSTVQYLVISSSGVDLS